MSNKAHFNPKSTKWLISLAIMIVLCVGVIFGSSALYNLVNGKYTEHHEIPFSIASTEEIDISSYAQASALTGVTSVEKALDSSGNTVAYIVTGTTVGYNTEVPIEMSTTVSADGTLICGIDIIKQKETEYLGVKVATNEFKSQFEGRLIPVVSSKDTAKGSKIDVISGSTISSQAVVDGVSDAVEFLSKAKLIEVTEQ